MRSGSALLFEGTRGAVLENNLIVPTAIRQFIAQPPQQSWCVSLALQADRTSG